jgi:hypothetical protein
MSWASPRAGMALKAGGNGPMGGFSGVSGGGLAETCFPLCVGLLCGFLARLCLKVSGLEVSTVPLVKLGGLSSGSGVPVLAVPLPLAPPVDFLGLSAPSALAVWRCPRCALLLLNLFRPCSLLGAGCLAPMPAPFFFLLPYSPQRKPRRVGTGSRGPAWGAGGPVFHRRCGSNYRIKGIYL